MNLKYDADCGIACYRYFSKDLFIRINEETIKYVEKRGFYIVSVFYCLDELESPRRIDFYFETPEEGKIAYKMIRDNLDKRNKEKQETGELERLRDGLKDALEQLKKVKETLHDLNSQ